MSGKALFFAAGGALAVKTLTVGDDGVSAYGYSASGGYGSLSPGATYVDRSGNTRTIGTLGYETGSGILALILNGSVPNTDTTFIGLIIGGVYLSRASASYSNPAASIWQWTPGSNIIGTSGMKVIQLT